MQKPNTSISEAELIEGCVRKDRSAQRALYETYAPKMLAVCVRYAGSKENARDILQEAFLTVFDKIGSYKGEGSFEGWMRRIFVNASLMYIRKNDVLKYSEDITEVPAADIGPERYGTMEQLSAKQIMDLVAAMPAGFRSVFNLYAIEGYSHAEIAEILGISEGTSRSQLNRGRLWLKERLEKL